MSRYIDCDESLVEVFLNVVEERFPNLANLNFRLIYDTKKRISKGKVCLASIELASPKIRFFTQDDKALEGYDYIIIVDHKAWELSSAADKKRLMSHEMRHVFIDEKGTPKIVDHEISDFYMELELNADDPEWGRNLVSLVSAVYDQEKDAAKDKKQLVEN
jgi:hypothetical protein